MKKKIFSALLLMITILFIPNIVKAAPLEWTNASALPDASGEYVLKQDVTLAAGWDLLGTDVTIDLNGFGITSNARIQVKNSGKLTIKDSSDTSTSGNAYNGTGYIKRVTTAAGSQGVLYVLGGEIDVQSGKIMSTSSGDILLLLKGSTDSTAANYSIATVGEKAVLTFDGNGYGYGVVIDRLSAVALAYGTVVNIYGTIDITPKGTGADNYLGGSGVYVNGTIKATTGEVPKINIYPTASITVNSPETAKNGGLFYAAGYATWNISGGNFISTNSEGLSIKAGQFNISGGTIITDTAHLDPAKTNNNGAESTGAAISITSNKNYAGNISLNITGGTFTSKNGHAIYEGIAQDNGVPAATSTSVTSVAISGGTYTGSTTLDALELTNFSDIATTTITAGTYSSDVSDYITGTNVMINENGTFKIADSTSYETSSDASTYNPSTDTAMSFALNGVYSAFQKVLINSKELDSSNYTIDKTTMTLQLKEAYLKTLADGKYTLTIVYTSGNSSTSFDISTITNPPTSDNILSIVLIGVTAILGFAVAFPKLAKKFNNT